MKIALLQLNSTADMSVNIVRVGDMVREAAGEGATLIATPENCFLMEASTQQSSPHPNPLPKGEGIKKYTQQNHPGITAAQAWAKELGVTILLGSTSVIPSVAEGSFANNQRSRGSQVLAQDKQFNRSILINPEGEITTTYDKIHLFDVDVPGDRSYRESDKMLAGDRSVVVELGSRGVMELNNPLRHHPITTLPSLGLTICYDVRFPHLYRALAKMGANIIAVPAAFTKITGEAHWHTLLRARAIENGCFIIAPAQTGTHAAGRETYGHSLVVDPWGRVLADGGEGEKIIYVEIDLSEVERVRARLPSLNHDRDFS